MKKVVLLLVVLLLSLTGCNKEKDITGPNVGESSTVKEVQKLIKEGNNEKAYEILVETGKTAEGEELTKLRKLAKQIEIREYEVDYYENGKLLDKTYNRYDKEGHLIMDKGKMRFYVDDASEVEYYIYSDYYVGKEFYNKDDKVVMIQYSDDGILDNEEDTFSFYEYFYNKAGQLILIDIKHQDNNSDTWNQKIKYEYDDQGRLFAEQNAFYQNDVLDENSMWRNEYIYDDHGQVIENISYTQGQAYATTKFTYEYDDLGNIIKKTTENDYVGKDTWEYIYDKVFGVVIEEKNDISTYVHLYEAASPNSKHVGLDESALAPYSDQRASITITSESIDIFKGPSALYEPVVGQLNKGDKVYVYETFLNEGIYWYMIGNDQWIGGDSLKLVFENSN